jgi:CPA1 family monovalent cation:H+ antiporter
VIVGAVVAAAGRTRERIPRSWAIPLVWGGLRGALSMVLALSLPGDFSGRDIIIDTTFGFVLISIVVQGTTMAPLLKAASLTADIG